MFPLTINPVNDPKLVMLGCAAVVSVPCTKLPRKLFASIIPLVAAKVFVVKFQVNPVAAPKLP